MINIYILINLKLIAESTKYEYKQKRMFQYNNLISVIIISIFPLLLYWMSILYTIFFSKTGKNLVSREFYECGFKVMNDNQPIIDIQYSIIGLIFLIYEMEVILFVPLFLNYYGYSIFYLFIIIFSFFIIAFSYIYEWDRYGLNFSF